MFDSLFGIFISLFAYQL